MIPSPDGPQRRTLLIYGAELTAAQYSDLHPFRHERAAVFRELLHRYYDLKSIAVESPAPINEELLYLFHTRPYIELLKKADKGEFDRAMLDAGLGTDDNPVFRGMFRTLLLIAGGTYRGAMALAEGEAQTVFDPLAGLHHAKPDHASGFCYVNDIAVAMTALVRMGLRVASVDIDVHHGDGVQEAFYGTERALTISFHEYGAAFFPMTGLEIETGIGRGTGYNVNIPLRAGTDDDVYVPAFEAIVPPLLGAFKPDVVFAQIGGDLHREDPLAHLNVTANGYKRVVEAIVAASPKLIAMGGGGYNVYKTASLWAVAWSVLSGTAPEDKFTGLVGGMMYGPEATAGKLDEPPFVLNGVEKELCADRAARAVNYIKENVFPVHGI